MILLTATPANASQYPGQEEARSVAIDQLVAIGSRYWNQQGVTGCHPKIWIAPDLQQAWGRGDGATCEVWLTQDLADKIVDPETIGPALDACTALTHELGHAFGLPHAPAGVMAGDGAQPPSPFAWTPAPCVVWARKEIRAVLRGEGIRERDLGWHLRNQMRFATIARKSLDQPSSG